ncbi:hypothetical protein A2783_00310 [Microgenomates group bacterium RIFCSPHIGHO2_01_FULL_45_11]|nr:MAG: hypothetical protein A2783_00310 [Microgenomates group bacterium RIFCSPHIGHO2_01_FULL_45_11]
MREAPAFKPGSHHMKVKTALVGLWLMFLVWVFLPYTFIRLNQFFGLPVFILPLLVKITGLLLIGLALFVDVYLLVLFKIFGKGTPVPVEPAKRLIAVGLYTKTRNPMYLGHLAIYLGLFLYLGHWALFWLFLVLAGGLHLLVIKWEEPGLKKRLGKEYFDYLKKVPRWI